MLALKKVHAAYLTDVVAISDIHLDKRDIRGIKATWLGKDRLKNVLEIAIKVEMKCVLLSCGTNRGCFGRIILLKN